MYRISYSLEYDQTKSDKEYELIGEADVAIENFANKLNNKGKCLKRQLFGFCYLENKHTWWSIAKSYEIKKTTEKREPSKN